MSFPEPRAAYIHVPFCLHRCGYCDFTVTAGRDDLIAAYLHALALELDGLGAPRAVETLFIGGGTPTHLPAPELDRLLAMVGDWFPLCDGGEFSVEANPADLGPDKIDVLARRGVNRVSLGVQSFDDDILRTLERDHRAGQVAATVERLQSRIANVSLDLIFGVPGQSLALWRSTLQTAIDLQPAHISTYGLTYEKGTAFWGRRQRGELQQAPDELERAMYAAAMDDLQAAGFAQYEISNFARPGAACRHNQVYWAGLPYFAAGPGAARYVAGRRETNHRSVTTWLRRVRAGESPVGEAEELSPEERARELIVLGLRRNAGVERAAFRQQSGFDLDALAGDTIQRHCRHGTLEDAGDRIRLTREGRFVADSVIVDFL